MAHPDACEVRTPWLTLGGSEEADAYLKATVQHAAAGVSLAQTNQTSLTSCSEAERICAKHLEKESEAGILFEFVCSVWVQRCQK